LRYSFVERFAIALSQMTVGSESQLKAMTEIHLRPSVSRTKPDEEVTFPCHRNAF